MYSNIESKSGLLILKEFALPKDIVELVQISKKMTLKGKFKMLRTYMITNSEIDKVVILYEDRLIRFGYELIKNPCEKCC